MKRSFRTWFLTVTIILILFVVVFFTYAWFTSTRAVSTNTVTARTDEENLELQLSSTGGSRQRKGYCISRLWNCLSIWCYWSRTVCAADAKNLKG